jgi:hypothetical protein
MAPVAQRDPLPPDDQRARQPGHCLAVLWSDQPSDGFMTMCSHHHLRPSHALASGAPTADMSYSAANLEPLAPNQTRWLR